MSAFDVRFIAIDRPKWGGKQSLAQAIPNGIFAPMAQVQQTIENSRDVPIYVYIEPWPECFELEKGDKLTLIWDAPEKGDVCNVDFISENELNIWPEGQVDNLQILFNGATSTGLSWKFRHR